MLPSFIITFREVLEAALVVGIVLSYLARTRQTHYNNVVYLGVISGIVASIFGALIFTKVAGGFSGRAEEIFEGVTMLVGAALLTTMILWMMKQKHITAELENRVALEISKAYNFGLFLLVFVSILREGIETVIFLGASSFVAGENTMVGALSGIVTAIILGYMIFVGAKKVNIKQFFRITSVLLIFFAAGLVAYGVHELQEAGIVPIIVEHLWNINPALYQDGGYPLLHENGHLGSILKGLFGYNGNPSLIEVGSYLTYLFTVALLWRNNAKVPRASRAHKVVLNRT